MSSLNLMKNLMLRALLLAAALLVLAMPVFAEDDDEDWDALFSESEDIVVESAPEGSAPTGTETTTSTAGAGGNPFFSPLHFYGSTNAHLGAGVIYDPKAKQVVDPYPAFLLESTLGFSARIDQYASINGSFSASFPPASSLSFSLGSLYFDYLLLDALYISAGKRSTTWGYTRIFSSSDSYLFSNKEGLDGETLNEIAEIEKAGYLYTNVVYDSGSGISALFRYPMKKGELSFIGYYTGNGTPKQLDELSFAAAAETTLFNTSLNLFARTYPEATKKQPVLGFEQKRTIFGFDVYAQEIGRLNSSKNNFSAYVFTVGFYRLWDGEPPQFGMNIEVQDSFTPIIKKHNVRIAADLGLKQLGKKRDMKLGLSVRHRFDNQTGSAEMAFIKSGVFPHADWNTGISMNYDLLKEGWRNKATKITALTTLKLSLSY